MHVPHDDCYAMKLPKRECTAVRRKKFASLRYKLALAMGPVSPTYITRKCTSLKSSCDGTARSTVAFQYSSVSTEANWNLPTGIRFEWVSAKVIKSCFYSASSRRSLALARSLLCYATHFPHPVT